jgi:ATPase complex subunit ATP10
VTIVSSEDPDGPNCTLVSLSFRNSGFKHIPTWTDHFSQAFDGDPRVQTFTVSITERWSLYPLKVFLSNVMRNNTPPEQHDTTLLYFGSDVDEFRDVLRMHNIMTNYVFLLDDLGCIRFAGSGPASKEETARLIQFAKELTVNKKRTGKGGKKRRSGPKAR